MRVSHDDENNRCFGLGAVAERKSILRLLDIT
jgi:hypothetical protein